MMIARKDRTRIIWASFVLITFLILLFVAIVFLGLKFDGLIGGQVIFMANVAVAISAAVIASSLTGFLDIVLERNFGKRGKLAVRAAGGFAVFLIVMWMSPSNQMKSLEQGLFAEAMQRCSFAVEGNSADGKFLCENLVAQYPNRPEPRRLLARYWHLRAVGIDDLEKARAGYQSALLILGFDPAKAELKHTLQDSRFHPELWENMRRYAASNADLALTRFKNDSQTDSLKSDLRSSLEVLSFFKKHYLNEAGEDEVLTYSTLEGRILFYLSQVEEEVKSRHQLLRDSFSAFNYKHPEGRRYFQRDLEALVVLASLRASQTNEEDLTDEINSIFSSLHDSWDHLVNTRRSSDSAPFFRNYVKKLAENSRSEKYRVTLLIGSDRYGGAKVSLLLQEYAAKLNWMKREFTIG